MSLNIFTTQKGTGLEPSIFKAIFSGMDILTKAQHLRHSDIVLSMDTLHGTLLSLIQSSYGLQYPAHVMVDSSSLPVVGSKFSLTKSLQRVFSSTRKIICFTSNQASFWNEVLGFVDKAVFMPLGVDSDYYSPSSMDISDYIFSAGRTARDIGTLLKAAKQINHNFVIVVGNNLHSEIGSLYVPKNVRLLFEVPQSSYKELLNKSKLVVLTLHDTPYSCGLSVLLHAMTMGKPVVITKVSSTIDYVSDWKTGVFVKPYDVNDLKQKILHLMGDYENAKKIGANARMQAERMYNEKIMASNFSRILNQVYHERKS